MSNHVEDDISNSSLRGVKSEALLGAFASLTHRLHHVQSRVAPNIIKAQQNHGQEREIRAQRDRVKDEILRRMS